MEHTLYISNHKNIKYWSKKYSRIYFGVEFCEKLLPSYDAIKFILRFVKEKSLDFTFVTPYITDRGIKKIRRLFDIINKDMPSVEVVINDAGILRILKNEYPHFTRVLGRLKTLHAPYKGYIFGRIKNSAFNRLYLSLLNKKGCQRASNFVTQDNIEYLESQGFSRLEVDVPVLVGSFSPPRLNFPISLYIPYGYISTTRYCPIALASQNEKKISVVQSCSFPCLDQILTLHSKHLLKPLVLRGNTYFYKTSLRKDKIKNVDRLVYQPVLPY